MNFVELQKKLIAAARANVPGDRVPYAFEKRVMALLASRVAPQNLDLWVRGLWRAAVSCVEGALRVHVHCLDPHPAGLVGDLRLEPNLQPVVDTAAGWPQRPVRAPS